MKEIEITAETVDSLFEGTNFGPRSATHEGRTWLMVDCVFKRLAGYSAGSTIEGICREAGLMGIITNEPTQAGARWAYHNCRFW